MRLPGCVTKGRVQDCRCAVAGVNERRGSFWLRLEGYAPVESIATALLLKTSAESCRCTGMRLFNDVDATRLPVLEPVLQEWISVVGETAEDWRGPTPRESDVPFWYRERAQLSLFAGALWRVNALAFEEFSATKHRAGRKTSGRADIWFKIRGRQFIGEAKHVSANAASNHEHLKDGMNEATENVAEHKQGKATALAMVFVTVGVLARHASEVNRRLDAWIEQAKDLKCDALAWTFPRRWRKFQHKKGDKLFPGCALLIKAV